MVTVQPGANVTSNLTDGTIQTLDDNDEVIINGGFINNTSGGADDDGVNTGNGNDVITMTAGTINATEDCLEGNDGNDIITVSGGVLECEDDGIEGDSGDDIITVTGGRIASTVDNDGIASGSGNDQISVSNATVEESPETTDHAIDAGSDDDTVTLGTGAVMIGDVDGGSDFDTLIFAMAVPENQIDFICAQLEAADPAAGDIVINNLFYEWEDFEVIVCNITGGFSLPVPTLSEWGLITMASILGIVGFMVMRRRKVTA